MSLIDPVGGPLGGPFGGPFGGTGNPVSGVLSKVTGTAAGAALHGISSWVLNGTKGALEEVASAISSTTAPNLESTWFSSTYWRVAALGAMLTIPFLCAAAVQAVARGDLGLLARSAFGYLPLSLLCVSLAAPLTMLLLAATDQMSAVVSASAATGGARFLDRAAQIAGALASADGSPFFAVAVGLMAVMAALALAIELLIRDAAVYVVVLMLPLAFAALVWPARRVWAARLVELLVSLVLSKFVIVAVLSLAASAFADGTPGIGALLVAMSLILLSTFAPWALMRILPFTELAAGAAGILHGELSQARDHAMGAAGMSAGPSELATQLPARLRNQAGQVYSASGDGDAPHAAPPPSPQGGRARTSNQDAGGQAAADLHFDWSEVGAGQAPAAGEAVPPVAEEDGRPPFVLPDAWRRSEAVRLDEQLLRPSAPDDEPAEDQP